MSSLRFAFAVAFSRDRRQRWRQISLILAGAIGLWAVALTAGLLGAVDKAALHSDARMPTVVMADFNGDLRHDETLGPPEGAIVRMVLRGTVIDGHQVPTVWIEPLPGHEGDPAAVPPGLRTMPAPGTAVLSPELIRTGRSAADAGWKPSDTGTGPDGSIGSEGLLTTSERLIYVRPADGRDLGVGTTPIFATGFGTAGILEDSDPETVADSFSDMFNFDPEVLSASMTAQASLWALILPGLVLLVSASRTRSALRDQRLALMVTLGIRERAARTVLALESAFLASSGAILGALTHALLAGHLTRIPATTIALLPGSLTIPWWVYPAAVTLIACIAGACGAIGRLHRPQARRSRQRPRPLATFLLAAALMLGLVSALIPGSLRWVTDNPERLAQTLFGISFLGSLVTLPLAVPFLTWVAAGVLSRSKRPAIWATGRRLRADATRLSRIGAVMGLLVLTVSAAVAFWSASQNAQDNEMPPQSSRSVLQVSWRSPLPGDLAQARKALTANHIDALVLPLHEEDDSKGPESDTLVVDDCPRTVEHLGGNVGALCSDPAALEDFLIQQTGHGLAPATAASDTDPHPAVLVIPKTSLTPLQLQHAWGALPGLNIDASDSGIRAPLPVQQWVIASALAALTILTIAAAREIGDRHLEDAERDAMHLRLGLSAGAVELLGWTTLLVPLTIALLTAYLAANLIAYGGEVLSLTRPEPLKFFVVTGITLAAAALSLAASGIARRASRAS